MKSGDGKSQIREEQKKEDQRKETLRRKKHQAREKVAKRNVFSNDLWLQRIEKEAHENGWCGAIWPDER